MRLQLSFRHIRRALRAGVYCWVLAAAKLVPTDRDTSAKPPVVPAATTTASGPLPCFRTVLQMKPGESEGQGSAQDWCTHT